MSESAFARILVPYDGSEPSDFALSYAIELGATGAELIVANVVDELPLMVQSEMAAIAYDPTPSFEAMDAQGNSILETAMLRARAARVSATPIVVHDVPVAGISALAKTRDCDLIIMGTHGRAGMARTFLGSTTEGVVRTAGVPVIAVREAARKDAYRFRTILVAIDDSDPSHAALGVAQRLVERTGTRMIACTAVDLNTLYARAATYGYDPAELADQMRTEARAMLDETLAEASIALTDENIILAEGEPVDAILATASTHAVDLIVVGSHGRKGLRRLVLGSVAEHVIRQSDVPVLVVRHE